MRDVGAGVDHERPPGAGRHRVGAPVRRGHLRLRAVASADPRLARWHGRAGARVRARLLRQSGPEARAVSGGLRAVRSGGHLHAHSRPQVPRGRSRVRGRVCGEPRGLARQRRGAVAAGDRRRRRLARDGLGCAGRGELSQAPAGNDGPPRAQRVHVVLRHGARDDAAGAAGAAVGQDPRHPVLRQRLRREPALRRARRAGHPAGMAVPGGRPGASPRDAILPAQVREQSPEHRRPGAALAQAAVTAVRQGRRGAILPRGAAPAPRERRGQNGRRHRDQRVQPERRAVHRRAARPCSPSRDMRRSRDGSPPSICRARSGRTTTTCWTAT